MFWSDGTQYEGQWKFGQRNGYGKLTSGQKESVGIFKNDKLV